jgi:hypothetical protein
MRSALCSMLLLLMTAPGSRAADADNGRRLAQARCVPCHAVLLEEAKKEVSDAPPFEIIARKFSVTPGLLAFTVLSENRPSGGQYCPRICT